MRPLTAQSTRPAPAVRVVLADDAPLIRAGVAHVLEAAGIEVVDQVDTARGLLRSVARHRPDVAISDIRMPPTHRLEGLEAATSIAREHPTTGILLLSQYAETRTLAELLRSATAGMGYLLKERVIDTESFAAAVLRVAGGGTALDPDIIELLMVAGRRGRVPAELSTREREVLTAMATGSSNSGVARTLGMSPKTVETHVRSIFIKLNLQEDPDENRRVKAVLTYLHGHSGQRPAQTRTPR